MPTRRARRRRYSSSGVPVLGICYGMQTMAQQLGGRVAPSSEREFGYAEVTVTGASRLLDHLADRRNAAGRARARCVDEPRRSGRRAAAGLRRHRDDRHHSLRRHERRAPPLLRRAVPSRSHAHARRARGCSSASCARSAAATRCGASATSSRMRSSACARRSARARCCSGSPAASTPRWSPPCCIARSASSWCACSSITGCCGSGEGDQVMSTFAQHLGVRVIRVDAEARFLDGARGRHRPGSQAQDHRPHLHRGVRGGSAQAERRAVSSPRARSIRT